jgi:hypothetical protein
MKVLSATGKMFLLLSLLCHITAAQNAYLGFDRNEYPGDANLPILRKTFSYAGFWLSNPPGARTNSWRGKRNTVQAAGFGFLVLFNGRTYSEIKRGGNANALGHSDGLAAINAAKKEGFPARTLIFLDQEEGGRMLPEQRAYLHAWIDTVAAGGFRAGVYCSGIAASEERGVTVITAEDIRANAAGRKLAYWVANDVCPPSPGCSVSGKAPAPSGSGVAFAEVWQYAQSPKRPQFAAACRNYSPDRNCYPPGIAPSTGLHVDMNTATSTDPSGGRTP